MRIFRDRPTPVREKWMSFFRMSFLVLCSGFVGASLSMMVHAQSSMVSERTARLETQQVDVQVRLAKLESDIDHTRTEVATMNGVGMGLGAALMILQILQMIIGKQKAL